MREFKTITFCEGISSTLTEFKKDFAPHLAGLSAAEVKQAHKIATKGNASVKANTEQRSGANSAEDKQ